MQQRRRISSAGSAGRARINPVLATLLVLSLVATAAFSGNHILKTQGIGGGPIAVSEASESLAAGETVVVDDAAIATQGEGEAERAVKEFYRDEPFSMFALTWHGEADIVAYVRAQRADGSWSEWYDTDAIGMAGADGKTGTELIYIEPTNRVQVNVRGVDGAEETPAEDTPAEEAPAEDTPGLAPLPSNYGEIQPVAETDNAAEHSGVSAEEVEVVFINGGEGLATGDINPVVDSWNTTGMPDVITRAQWGANEAIRCSQPTYVEPVTAVTVHHTAGSNNYSAAEAPGIVRGIYNYHASTLGWCDTGYAALVDKYGKIYEGRAGGMDRAVKGAHVGAFNENTWGVSILGNYMTAFPSEESIRAVGELAGWKAAVSDFAPLGSSWHTAEFNFTGSKYAAGQGDMFPNINAHRDFHYNLCPGDHVYSRMGDIRTIADQRYREIKSGTVSTQSNQSPQVTQAPGVPTDLKPGESRDVVGPDGTTTRYTAKPAPGSTSQRPEPTRRPQGNGTNQRIQDLLVASSQGDSTAQATVGLSLALLAGTYALREGLIELPGGATSLGDITIFQNLKVSDIAALASGASKLSSNSEISQKYQQIERTLGPVLGQPTTRELRSGVDLVATGNPVLDSIIATATSPDAQRQAGKAIAFFEQGLILYSQETGARALWGEIANAWIKQGMDLGALGLPLTEEYYTSGGSKVRVDFQGGAIVFDPATGAVDIQHS